jgi:uncharacterized membrane protein YphA (DoxX/SURF4 family)
MPLRAARVSEVGERLRAVWRVIAHPLFVRLVGLGVGAVFVWASLDKIAHADQFADVVNDYDMLPVVLINAFALVMPWPEVTAGAVLIVGVWRRAAGLVATALTVAFMIAIAQAEVRGLDIACGCFDVSGMSATEAGWDLFFRDIALLLGCMLVWRRG